MQRNFTHKTVVITGACRGIGAGIAERFARDGANLVMVSNAERVHETAETLRQRYQADILSLQVDVTDEAQVQSLYEQAAARFGAIDVSIQNAGVITIDYYDRMPKADFEKVLAVNTTGVWLCCREAAKYMVKQNHGSLINTSSGQGRQGFIYTPHYAASKMGVIGITQSLAHELAPWNITVNAFCPGIIESEMWDYNDRVWGEILTKTGITATAGIGSNMYLAKVAKAIHDHDMQPRTRLVAELERRLEQAERAESEKPSPNR